MTIDQEQWSYARQRDFTGGETLATLPEKVGRNQLIRMTNCIISPKGLVTECWQMDKALFVNVSGGLVIAPIPGSKLFTVYGASGDDIISFTFDPSSPTPYDMADATGYPNYEVRTQTNPVTIQGITHGTPFLGKNYCCADTNLYIETDLTADPASIAFGTVQNLWNDTISVTITNDSAGDVTLNSINFDGLGSGDFGHTATFPQTLAAAGTYTFNVVFTPLVTLDRSCNLNLTSSIGILQIPVTGVSEPMLTPNVSTYDYGTVLLNTHIAPKHVFSVANSGPQTATILSVEFTGENPEAFSNAPALLYHTEIPAGGSTNISIQFGPTSAQSYSATINIVTDLGTVSIAVIGNAI